MRMDSSSNQILNVFYFESMKKIEMGILKMWGREKTGGTKRYGRCLRREDADYMTKGHFLTGLTILTSKTKYIHRCYLLVVIFLPLTVI